MILSKGCFPTSESRRWKKEGQKAEHDLDIFVTPCAPSLLARVWGKLRRIPDATPTRKTLRKMKTGRKAEEEEEEVTDQSSVTIVGYLDITR